MVGPFVEEKSIPFYLKPPRSKFLIRPHRLGSREQMEKLGPKFLPYGVNLSGMKNSAAAAVNVLVF